VSVNFDRIADRYDATRGGTERGERSAAVISPYLPATGRVFEIGIGTGLVASAMNRDVVGVDISRQMIGNARRRIGNRIAQAEGAALPFPGGTFAGGYAVWVFHLVADRTAVFTEVARVLVPAGVFVIQSTEWYIEDGDPIQAILTRMYTPLVGEERRDAGDMLAAAAAPAGLDMTHTVWNERTFEEAPVEVIGRIETRTGAALWDLDDERWKRIVDPVLDDLRALPDQDRRRVRRGRYPTSVFVKR
jgi:SAM-dependent methyltransferase